MATGRDDAAGFGRQEHGAGGRTGGRAPAQTSQLAPLPCCTLLCASPGILCPTRPTSRPPVPCLGRPGAEGRRRGGQEAGQRAETWAVAS